MKTVTIGIGLTVAVATTLTIITLSVVPTIRSLHEQNEALSQSLRTIKSTHYNTGDEIPTKFAPPYPTPRYYQEDRGTCWDFATIGFLEHSYRANGIKKGFLKEDEYVRLNNQAFGISMIRACQKHPDVCDVLGDFVLQNSTSGGEIYWLWNLKELYDKLLPASVCPYTDPEHELECPGMDAALAKNPIKFDVEKMDIAYSLHDTKKLMLEKDAALTWTSAIHNPVYFVPCNMDSYWSSRAECSEEKRVRCPTDRNYGSEWCAEIVSTMFNVEGEFFMAGRTVSAGGHGMNVVGYNDEFTTKNGHTGGFIIKNSWHDALYGTDTSGRGARGSHSIAYWMQDISAYDEKAICPLPLNPDNWISCVEQAAGPHGTKESAVKREENGDYDIKETCLSKTFMDHLLNVSLQPTEFICKDEAVCSKDLRYRYFFISLERNVERDLARATMLQYDTITGAQKVIVTPYHIPSHIAYFFEPIPAQLSILKNSEDLCGYWFWPYEMLYKQQGLLQNYFSIYFDIKWDDSSYAANKAKYPNYDYSWIEKSTFKMSEQSFNTPNPHANNRY